MKKLDRLGVRITFVILVILMVVALTASQGQSQATGTVQIVPGGIGNGRVTSELPGIDCTIGPGGLTGTCFASFPAGARPKLDARPAPDSSFRGWAPLVISDCEGGDPTVVAGATHSCQPIFELNGPTSFLLQAIQVGSGRITSSPAGIDCTFDSATAVATGSCAAIFPSGTVAALTATPLDGWSFSNWSGDPDCNDGVVMMNEAKRCTATFVSGTQTFTLTITKRGEGTVTSFPTGIDCGADCSEPYASGTVVTLTATPAAGWRFDRWRGNADCTDGVVTMNAGKTCTAEFKR